MEVLQINIRSSRQKLFCKKGVLSEKRDSGAVEFCEISKNTFSYRTPPVAAFEYLKLEKVAKTRRRNISLFI